MKPSLLPATVGSLLLGFASLPLHAAGMATHALMAEYGRTYLADSHPLKAILTAHRPALLAGAIYPDGGYFTGIVDPAGRDIAEHAHWEYFHNPLMEVYPPYNDTHIILNKTVIFSELMHDTSC